MHNDDYIGAAGYRRLAHSKFGCRTNTTAAVGALALHPGTLAAAISPEEGSTCSWLMSIITRTRSALKSQGRSGPCRCADLAPLINDTTWADAGSFVAHGGEHVG